MELDVYDTGGSWKRIIENNWRIFIYFFLIFVCTNLETTSDIEVKQTLIVLSES